MKIHLRESQKDTLRFVAASMKAVFASDICKGYDLTPPSARSRLDRLVEHKLLTVTLDIGAGATEPRLAYSLTAAGRAALAPQ